MPPLPAPNRTRELGRTGEDIAVSISAIRVTRSSSGASGCSAARSTSSPATAARSSSWRSRPGATNHGRPEESVTPAKQRQIRRIAQGYLLKNVLGEVPCRFDVVAILYRAPDDYRLEHFKDAF